MKKLFLVTALFLFVSFFLTLFRPQSIIAQSPIKCGYENEPCCNLAGSPPNSCKSPLTCVNGKCIGQLPRPTGPVYSLQDKVFCDSSNNPTSTVTTRIYTAIGCIPVANTPDFIEWILGWAIGIGGGISLMLIIVASFQILTSSGNPEKVQAGKELLTSAIAGLIMLIFSVFILKIIGIDILKLPGIN